MSHPKPTGEQLRAMLNTSHFGNDPGPLTPSDPIGNLPMQLAIDRIDFYDHNPRRIRNARYDEIKESIRAQGMKQPLVVTRRPGAEHYVLRFGGNTRLSILRELFAETGERRFGTADCVFVPWTTETDVLVGHLIENETRGELCFIDKARAVREAGQLIAAERNAPVSKRQLADVLKERGYRIDHAQISRYEYTLDVLADAIPVALEAGVGTLQVRRLRHLDSAAERVWQQHQLGAAEIYRTVFKVALSGVDSRDWDFDRARRSVETTIANRAGIDVRLITLDLDAEIEGSQSAFADESRPERIDPMESIPYSHGDTVIGSHAESAPPPLQEPTWEPAPLKPLTPHTGSGAATAARAATAPSAAPANPESLSTSPFNAPGTIASDAIDHPADSGENAPTPLNLSDPESIQENLSTLRQRLRLCGETYARLAGLERCIRSEGAPWSHLGYLVIDFPDTASCAAAARDERQRQILAWSWWTLTLCCDLILVNEQLAQQYPDSGEAEAVRTRFFGSDSRFVGAWRDLNTVTLAIRQTVGLADPFGYSDYVDAATPGLWAAHEALHRAYREIRAFAAATGIDVIAAAIEDLGP